jgi:hypothetical protein
LAKSGAKRQTQERVAGWPDFAEEPGFIEPYLSAIQNTTPEDLARTAVPHVTYLFQRKAARGKLTEWKTRLRRRVGARMRQLKQGRRKA